MPATLLTPNPDAESLDERVAAQYQAAMSRATPLEAQDRLDALGDDTKDAIAQALRLPELKADLVPPEHLATLISAKNSNAAGAERLRAHIQDLLDHPESFTPRYERRYRLLLAHCRSVSPLQAWAMSTLLGQDSVRGYEQMPLRANLRFPRDHAEQLQTQIGWYFFAGSCTGDDGKDYGVEVMLFRAALLPPPLAARLGLSDVENQVLELHLAIAEAGDRHYQAVPYLVAGTTGLLEFRGNTVYARMGKNVVEALHPGSVFPLHIAAAGTCRGSQAPVELAVDLTFASAKPHFLQGAEGCMPCCGGIGTLDYETPHLRLDAGKSRLRIKGRDVALDSGRFWFEHQWGTGLIPAGSPRDPVLRAVSRLGAGPPGGWDWFFAHFTNGGDLLFYWLHTNEYRGFFEQTGAEPPGTMTVPLTGKYVDADGRAIDAPGTLRVTEWVKAEDSPDPARYWITHTWYPNAWEFRLGEEVPDEMRAFRMIPIVSDGSAGAFAFGAQYSEGAVYLRDAQGKDLGRGWAEGVLYADPRRNILALAGLPVTQQALAVFDPQPPSLVAKLWSLAYVSWPPHRKRLRRLLTDCVEAGLPKL